MESLKEKTKGGAKVPLPSVGVEVWKEMKIKTKSNSYGSVSFALDDPNSSIPYLITYGGVNSVGQTLDELVALPVAQPDPQPVVISLDDDSDVLVGISFHSALVYKISKFDKQIGTRVFVFGGRTNSYSRDVYQLRFPAKFDASKDKANFKKVDVVSSSLPSGRYGHSAFLQQSESRARMIVFGGYDQDGSPNNEMWSLEVGVTVYSPERSVPWLKMDKTSEHAPPPRYHHASVVVSTVPVLQVLVYGGRSTTGELGDMWLLTVDAWTLQVQWEEVRQRRAKDILPRYGHSMVYIPSINSVVVQGGYNKSKDTVFDDVLLFDLVTKRWKKVDSVPNSGLYFHSMCLFDTKWFISGGSNQQHTARKSASLWSYRQPTLTIRAGELPLEIWRLILQFTVKAYVSIDITPTPQMFWDINVALELFPDTLKRVCRLWLVEITRIQTTYGDTSAPGYRKLLGAIGDNQIINPRPQRIFVEPKSDLFPLYLRELPVVPADVFIRSKHQALELLSPYPYKTGAAVKCVWIGSGGVGKTSLLCRAFEPTFNFGDGYIPTVFDNYVEQLNIIKHNGSAVSVNFGAWDTAGGEDYWRLRFLAYPQTDCFILCFDISKPDQLEYIYTEWMVEVVAWCKKTPVLLVGCKKDLLDQQDSTSNYVSYPEAAAFARKLGMIGCLYCSAKTGEGVRDVIEAAGVIGLAFSLTGKRGFDFLNVPPARRNKGHSNCTVQ